MAGFVPVHIEKYRADFEEQMHDIDELAQVIVKGHLIIEGALENIISQMFFHPEYVLDARLSFHQKVGLARAYGLRKDKISVWSLILEINKLRNEMAHRLRNKRRELVLVRFRRVALAEINPEKRSMFEGGADQDLAIIACSMSLGFLAELEQDTKGLRRHMDTLDAVLNPNQRRVTPPQT